MNRLFALSHLVTATLAVFVISSAFSAVQQKPTVENKFQPQFRIQSSLFSEPLIAIEEPKARDIEAVKTFFPDEHSTYPIANLKAVNQWVDNQSDSPFTLSLYYNIGKSFYHLGFFTRAEHAWASGWELGKHNLAPEAARTADACFAELIRMHSRLGRIDLEIRVGYGGLVRGAI